MTATFRRSRAALAALAAAALLAGTAACGSGGSGGAGSSAPPTDGGFPVSITSALGTTEITQRPERVVTLGWGSTEAALALGVTPVGVRDMSSDSGDAGGILPWVQEKLGDAKPALIPETGKSIPLEQIAALRPDVILSVQSGLTAEQYEKLSRIAPTVAQPGRAWQTSWQDQVTLVGKALGRGDEAAKLIERTDAQIAAVKSEHPEFAGKTVAAAGVTTTEGVNFYFDTDPRNRLLEAMGFTGLPALARLRESAPAGKFAAPVSWENVPEYSADVMTAWFLDETTQRDAEANPVFAALPAVRGGAYVPITDPPLVFAVSSPNVLNMSWLLQRFVPKLSEAAKHAA